MTVEQTFLLHLIRACVNGDVGSPVPDSVNWDSLIELASDQGVTVIASDGLQMLYNAGVYKNLGDKELRRTKVRWFSHTVQYEKRYADQMAAAKRLGKWLATDGIQTVILKGFIVSACYPIPSHRYSADFDCFLIKEGNHPAAFELGNKVVEKHGIAVDREYYKNSSFSVGELFVENHRFIVPFRGNDTLKRLERLLQDLVQSGPLTPFGDTGLLVPSPLASALFLTEHAYSHFLHEGLNLKHFLDWALFRRKHLSDVDWMAFDKYVDEFGFRRFYDAFSHIGEFILGERDLLTAVEQRMLDSVWAPLDLHDTVKGWRGKLALVGNTCRARWKYHYFSDISMLRALWIQVKGVLFIKDPVLS